mmetsp:Transcript_3495/g.6566  ORF Transcript_3495/g.6566 Transcript_3495/m.6566 type:complete len:204 (-) Transcript_3495:86-697(-)
MRCTFAECLDRVEKGDPCEWGKPNTTRLDIGAYGEMAARRQLLVDSNMYNSDFAFATAFNPAQFPWDPSSPKTTPAPPPAHGGWHGLTGQYHLVWLPGALAMISLFFINTVEARHLTTEADLISGGQTVALKIWLCFGFLVGIGAIVAAFYVYVELFTRNDAIQNGPGLAAIIQTLLLLIASLLFWLGRSVGMDSELTDPFLW